MVKKKQAMARLLLPSTTTSVAIFFFVTLWVLLIPSKSFKSEFRQPQNPKVSAFFIFGDSFLDSGNNNYINTTTLDQANFWPYGETFFGFPTGRFSDGRLVSDFIAQYAKLPFIPPFLRPGIEQKYNHGVNFASAGAGALVQTFQGAVINLRTQLSYFKRVEAWLRQKLGNVEAENSLSRAVYFFSIGTNDYMSPFLTNSTILHSFPKSVYVGMVIGNLTAVLKELYGRGGRKFGFFNLGPVGCFPGIRILKAESDGDKCLEEVSELAQLHNEALSKMFLELENQLKGFKHSLYDFDTNLRKITRQPHKYGFKEGKTACCGTGRFRGTFSCGGKRPVKEFELCNNPSEYVFWDSFHLTEKFHEQMADQMWAGDPTVVKPYNLKNLFQCL